MTCREFEDGMEEHFATADPSQIRDLIAKEQWQLLPPSRVRAHLASCNDCPHSLWQFLKVRGFLDYRSQPCFHVTYHSSDVPERCLEKQHGLYAITCRSDEGQSIVIGFCPWCGTALPTGI